MAVKFVSKIKYYTLVAMKLIRNILLPVVPIYYLVTWLRNKFYDAGIFKSTSYDFPLIAVGNLSVGGTGKTPMIEYLIRLLKSNYEVATLSRGYGRVTKGFVLADKNTNAMRIGDEPFQFYSKFETIKVAVDANRREGIVNLRALTPKPDVILLDDAFQHRKVKAGFYVLLTSYNALYVDDFLLPTGNLRESKQGAKRANAIVITKCPPSLSEQEKSEIIKRLKPNANQDVFFSSIEYSNTVYSSAEEQPLEFFKDKKITLVTGIANANPLVEYLKSKALDFKHLNFKDHHLFSENEINALKEEHIILTTEKDYMRLSPHFKGEGNLYYLPIQVSIDDKLRFDRLINHYIESC